MRDAGSLLVRAGLIDSDALAQARADRAKSGGTLAEHLVLAGVVEDDALTQFYRERLMVPRVSSERLRTVAKKIIARIPAELAGELRVVPVALDSESSLTVAMSDPSDTHALDELEFFTEHYVVRAVASQRMIAWCLDHYYGLATPLLETTERFIEAETTPFIEVKTEPFAKGPRKKRLSEAVRESRRRVVPPKTAPPPPAPAGGDEGLEATLADLEASEGLSEIGDRTDVDHQIGGRASRPSSPLDQAIEELDEASYELVLEDDDELASERPQLELDADEPTAETQTFLKDGSPGELAPRVGEVLVNLPSDHHMGAGPAVVLDDSVFMASSASARADNLHEPVDDDDEETGQVVKITADRDHELVDEDDEKTGQVIRIEAEEPEPSDGVITETVERGTESAPILLSEIKQAVLRAERASRESDVASDADSELEIEPVDASDVDADAIVLLEMPKRVRRSTSLGVGAPASRAASVLGLRTQTGADSLKERAKAHRRQGHPDSVVPVITDDHDNESPLSEIDPRVSGQNQAIGRQLSGHEAAAVAELDAGWSVGDDEPEDGAERDRLLDTLELLARAKHRDEIVAAVLDYLDHYCDRVVFLALKSGALEPFQIRSSAPIKPPKSARLPLREVSLLRDIVDTRLPYRGPLEDEPSQKLIVSVFGDIGPDGLALPVAVRGRVVGLLYGDGIAASLSGENVGLVTQAAGRALERSLRAS